MRDLTQLRRKAERLREKAEVPVPRDVPEGLGVDALEFLIEDAYKMILRKAELAEQQAELDALI